jgi:hypothetical protein
MAHYESDAELYEELGGILRNLLGNTERLTQLRHADAVVQFAFEQPDARVTIDVREGHDPRIDFGETELQPEVVLAMGADVGRAVLTGEKSIAVALAHGEIRTKGAAGKVLRIVPATVGAHEVEPDQPLPEPGRAAAAEDAPAAEGEAPAAEGPAAEQSAEQPEGAEAPAEEAAAEDAPAEDAAAAEEPAAEEQPAEGEQADATEGAEESADS